MKTIRDVLLVTVLGLAVAMHLTGCDTGGDDGGGSSDDTNKVTTAKADGSGGGSGGSEKSDPAPAPSSSGSDMLPGSPGIAITGVSAMGTSGNASGKVSGVVPNGYVVATYIEVSGAWWIKPYSASTTSINSDGSWSVDIDTGGSDKWATQVMVFLVPVGITPPNLLGSGSAPSISGCLSASASR